MDKTCPNCGNDGRVGLCDQRECTDTACPVTLYSYDPDDQPADSDRNASLWVRDTVVENVRETGGICSSGAWLAREREDGSIDTYRFEKKIDP